MPELILVVTTAFAVAAFDGATALVWNWFQPWLPTLPASVPPVALEAVSTVIALGAVYELISVPEEL